jgi:TonB family protein
MRAFLAAVLTALLVATGSAAQQQGMARGPRELDPIERVVYSDAIAALSRLPPPPDTVRRARAFFVHFDSTGRPDTVRAAFPLVDSAFAARVRDALQPALRMAPPFRPFDLTVVVNTGSNASVTPVDFFYRQRPSVANPTVIRTLLRRAVAELQERDTLLFGRQLTVHVRMIANVDGTATSAAVTRSSGVPAVDSVAVEIASAVRFSPAVVDRAPTPIWVVQPMTVVFPEESEAQRRRRLRRQAGGSSLPE